MTANRLHAFGVGGFWPGSGMVAGLARMNRLLLCASILGWFLNTFALAQPAARLVELDPAPASAAKTQRKLQIT